MSKQRQRIDYILFLLLIDGIPLIIETISSNENDCARIPSRLLRYDEPKDDYEIIY